MPVFLGRYLAIALLFADVLWPFLAPLYSLKPTHIHPIDQHTYELHQHGDFGMELFYLLFFFLTAVFLCKAAESFSEQRKAIVAAKRKAEENVVKLDRARRAADSANRSKSTFLANMSHELRTPLNHILGFAEVVVDEHFGKLNQKQIRYLNNIVSSGVHLLSLVNDILDIAKVEAGKMQLAPSDINLSAMLQKVVKLIDYQASEKMLHIDLKIDEKLQPMIRADERALYQVLHNLLSNAVKFTSKKGWIQVSAAQARMNGAQVVRFRVRDNGIGIAQNDIDRLFMPFEQVDNSAKRHYQGTGLGLSLSRKLVELHGGTIQVCSNGEGKGSEFSFTIPVQPPLTT